MTCKGKVFKTVDNVAQTVVGLVHVRIVDLERVARENHFRIFADSRNDRFDFVRSKVLRLVDDDELFGNASSADIGESFDFNHLARHKLVHFADAVHVVISKKIFQVVENRLHPRFEFFIDRAGQETDILSHRINRSCYEHFRVFSLFKALLQTSRDSKKGFSRSRRSDEAHEFYSVIHQKVQSKSLSEVSRLESPHFLELFKRNDRLFKRIYFDGCSVLLADFCINEFEKLVCMSRFERSSSQRIKRDLLFFKNTVDKSPFDTQSFVSGREFVEIYGIVSVILGLYAVNIGFYAEIDVLADKNDFSVRVVFRDFVSGAKNYVVGIS